MLRCCAHLRAVRARAQARGVSALPPRAPAPAALFAPRAFALSPEEANVVQLLRDVVRQQRLAVVPRICGGWVRDKILGVSSLDIDVAVDKMSGVEFATAVRHQLNAASPSPEPRKIYTMKVNPAQSKHLEVSKMMVCGFQVDFVNLRTDVYSRTSRIPTVSPATPHVDALRRDFTVNALFYNTLNDTVEDFTGQGLYDLRDKVLRTPLEAEQTLLDDPLRVLRGLRFATTLQSGFRMAPELEAASGLLSVRDALRTKVSRERIGIEMGKACSHPRFAWAVLMVGALGLRDEIFAGSSEFRRWDDDAWQRAVGCVLALQRIPDVRSGVVHGDALLPLITAALVMPLIPRAPAGEYVWPGEGEDPASLVRCAWALNMAMSDARWASSGLGAVVLCGMKWKNSIAKVAEKFAGCAAAAPPLPPCAANAGAWGEWVEAAGAEWRLHAMFAEAMASVGAGPVVASSADVERVLEAEASAPPIGESLVRALEASLIPDVVLRNRVGGEELKGMVPSVRGVGFPAATAGVRAWRVLHPTATLEDVRTWLLTGGEALQAVLEGVDATARESLIATKKKKRVGRVERASA